MESKLVIIPSDIYNYSTIGLIKDAVENNAKRVCYITLNKTYKAMIQIFDGNSISTDNFYFVDFISPTVFTRELTNNCSFFELSALRKFVEWFSQYIKENDIDVVFFDSLSSLLIYKTDVESINFVNSIYSTCEEKKMSMIFLCLSEDSETSLIKQIKMMVNDVRLIRGGRKSNG